MSDMNNWTGIGRLTKNAELLSTGKGIRFSIANNGYKKGDVTFFDCIWFTEKQLNIAEYMTKGKQIAVSGRIENRRWTTKSGETKDSWQVAVSNIELLGSKDSVDAPERSQINDYPDAFEKKPVKTPDMSDSEEWNDDDIPF